VRPGPCCKLRGSGGEEPSDDRGHASDEWGDHEDEQGLGCDFAFFAEEPLPAAGNAVQGDSAQGATAGAVVGRAKRSTALRSQHRMTVWSKCKVV